MPASHPEKQKIPTSLFPHLAAYISPLRNLPDSVQENILSKRRPNKENRKETVLLPEVEAIPHLLQNISGDKFIDNLQKYGLVGTADGVKIQDIDKNISPAVADAIILGNMELLIKTAQELDLTILLGKYSGDEDVFFIAPNNPSNWQSKQNLAQSFNAKLSQNKKEFYNQPYFQDASQLINQRHQEQIGLTTHFADPNKVWIYAPEIYDQEGKSKQSIPKIKSAIGAVIDAATQASIIPQEGSRISLLDYLSDILKEDLHKAEISPALEGIYPKHLEVYKIAHLVENIRALSQEIGDPVYLIRLANIRLKHTNKYEGHTKGDHELIATADIIRRLSQSLGIEQSDVIIHQHNGSHILVLTPSAYQQLAPHLEDSASFNSYYEELELNRQEMPGQDPRFRAHPYIVSTTQIMTSEGLISVIIDQETPAQTIWEAIDLMRDQQLFNETLNAFIVSGMAHQIAPTIIAELTGIIKEYGQNPSQLKEYLLTHQLFLELFNSYHAARPNNWPMVWDHIKDSISHPIVAQIKNHFR